MKNIGELLVQIGEKCKSIESEKERNELITKEIFSYINNQVLCSEK